MERERETEGERERVGEWTTVYRRNYRRKTLGKRLSHQKFLRDDCFTLFVDDLPLDMDNIWLRQILRGCSNPIDVFVSNRVRQAKIGKFAFVRFRYRNEAKEVISKLNGVRVRDNNIMVKWADYDRNNRPIREKMVASGDRGANVNKHKITDAPRNDRSLREVVENGKNKGTKNHNFSERGNLVEENEVVRTVSGSVCAVNVERLSRSLVAYSGAAVDVQDLKNQVMKLWPQVLNIVDLGRYKFLITFSAVKDMETALDVDPKRIAPCLNHLEKWSKHDFDFLRRAKLKCYGMPLHGCSLENFRKIGGIWGDVVPNDDDFFGLSSLEAITIVIDTTCMETINEKILLSLDDGGGYVIWVKETGCDDSCQSHRYVSQRNEATMEVPVSKIRVPAGNFLNAKEGESSVGVHRSVERAKDIMIEEVEKVPETQLSKDPLNVSFERSKVDFCSLRRQVEVSNYQDFLQGRQISSGNGNKERDKVDYERLGPFVLRRCSPKLMLGSSSRVNNFQNGQHVSPKATSITSLRSEDCSISSSSDPVIPPGFADFPPQTSGECFEKAQSARAKEKVKQRRLLRRKIYEELEADPCSSIQFAKKLGLRFDGGDDELKRRIHEIEEEEIRLWREARTD